MDISHQDSIPVFAPEPGKIQVGPFRVDLSTRNASVHPWPSGWPGEWDRCFSVLWSSDRYMPWRNGGVWVVQVKKQWSPVPVAIFIGRNGEFIDAVDLPSNFLKRNRVVLSVFGEWVQVNNALFQRTKLVKIIPESYPPMGVALDLSRSHLGPDGMILFHDGNVLHPDGRYFQMFLLDHILKELQGYIGPIVSREVVWTRHTVLGWDDQQIWLGASVFKRVEKKHTTRTETRKIIVRAIRKRNNMLSIDYAHILEPDEREDVIPLQDGGWVVRIHKQGPDIRTYLVRRPGRKEPEKHSLQDLYRDVHDIGGFFLLVPSIGLVSVLQISSQNPKFPGGVYLWLMDHPDRPLIRFMDYYLSGIDSGKWLFLRTADNEEKYFVFLQEAIQTRFPDGVMSGMDILSILRIGILNDSPTSPDYPLLISDVAARENILLVHAKSKGNPNSSGYGETKQPLTIVASVKLTRNGPELVDHISVYGDFDRSAFIFRDNELEAFLRREEKFLQVNMDRTGNLSAVGFMAI